MNLILLLLGAYLLGGVPVGLLVSRSYGIDITKVGSGNIGATNVSRALGAKAWYIVFPLDVLKGLLPAVLARWLVPEKIIGIDPQALWFICGMFGVLGHCISPFLKFKGGKGVAAALGAGLGAAPLAAILAFASFGIVLATTRYMVLASMAGVWSVALFAIFLPGQSVQLIPFFVVLGLLVTYRHRNNFTRLRAGIEPKFSFRDNSKYSPAVLATEEFPEAPPSSAP